MPAKSETNKGHYFRNSTVYISVMDFRIRCFEGRNQNTITRQKLWQNHIKFAFMMGESIMCNVLITVIFLIKNVVPIVKAFVLNVLLLFLFYENAIRRGLIFCCC